MVVINICMPRKWSDKQKLEIINYAKQHSKAAAKRQFGVSTEAINYWTKESHRNNIKQKQQQEYLKNHINSKFTCAQMRDIKKIGLVKSQLKYNLSTKDFNRAVQYITRTDKYNQINKEILKCNARRWFAANKQHTRDYDKQYVKRNRDKIRNRTKLRRHNDIQFKLKENIRRRIWGALKGNEKYTTTEQLIGCNIEQFKIYLEQQFTDGMSWDNYGMTWHVDHIKPVSLFDLTLADQQQQAFHYTNCQPLFAEHNLKKSNKYE